MQTDDRILALLSRSGPELTAREIGEIINIFPASELWVSLLRLEDAHRIVSRWVEGDYPRRRVYSVPIKQPHTQGEP